MDKIKRKKIEENLRISEPKPKTDKISKAIKREMVCASCTPIFQPVPPFLTCTAIVEGNDQIALHPFLLHHTPLPLPPSLPQLLH